MIRLASRFFILAIILVTSSLMLTPVQAKSTANPVASGLTNPRGIAWNEEGAMFVALAGAGGETAGTPDTPPPLGPFMGGPTGAIARIDNGCPVLLAEGLPSVVDGTGGVFGPEDIAILDGTLYYLQAGGGEPYGNAGSTNGVYSLFADGTSTLVADYSAWLQNNGPASPPPEGFPNPGNPFTLIAGDGLLYMADALNGLIVTIATDGTITLLADVSQGHPVPTGMALGPDGSLYVGSLTAAPFVNGTAKVMQIAADGTVTDVWTGLTTVTGVAVGADGALYAIEMSTGNTDAAPFLVAGSGQLVKQSGPDSSEVVTAGLMFPISLREDSGGMLFISTPALGADDGSGAILMVDPAQTEETAATEAPVCEAAAPAAAATPVAAATPESPIVPPAASPEASPAA